MRNFTGKILIASFILSGVITSTLERVANRLPANAEEGFELTLQSVSLTPGSKIDHLKNAFFRAVVNNKEIIEINKDQQFTLAAGETKRIDQKIELKSTWINQDALEFRLEIVEAGLIESVRLRCSTISKGLSVYNRAYECTVPGEQAAVISYRVARKGAPLPESSKSLAQN